MRRPTPEGMGHNTDKRTIIMSDVITEAVTQLNAKLAGGFVGRAKFVLTAEGSIMMDADGARAGDDDAEVTLTATAETFQAIMEGEQNPTAAFMSGQLTVDGDMGTAMKLASVLA